MLKQLTTQHIRPPPHDKKKIQKNVTTRGKLSHIYNVGLREQFVQCEGYIFIFAHF